MPAFYPEGDEPKLADPTGRSLHKINNLLKSIEAKTGSATITGAVTVNNEVEIKNTENNPIPVSDNGGSLTVDGTVTADTGLTQPLTDTQLRATAVPVSGTVTANTGLTQPLTDAQLRAAVVPVSLDSVPSHAVTGSGSFTAAQATAANLNATVVGSGSFTAAQSTASNLKAQAQLLNASGSVVDYAMTGVAGTPASDVVTIQGIVGGTTVPVSLASVPSHPVTGPLTNTELRASAVPVSLASVPSHPVTGPLTNTELRATAVPVSGTVTANTGLSQPLTDTQLRATAVPVSGTVTSRIADGAGNNLTSAARGSERALSVQIVDASGAQVTTFGGGGGGAGSGLTDTELRAAAVPVSLASVPTHGVTIVSGTTGEAIVTSFSSLTSGTLKAANASRKLLTIFNEGVGTLFILYGNGTASTTNYSLRLLGGDYLEVDKYTGNVVGIFGGTGTAKITEIT